ADADADADAVVIGGQPISRPLYLIFLSEADELIQVLSDDIADWRGQPTRGAGEAAMRAVHSLAGSSAVVGLTGVHDIAERLDRFYQAQRACADVPEPHELESLAFVIERLRAMLHQFAAGSAPRPEPEAFETMAALLAAWVGRKPRARPGPAQAPEHTDADGTDDTLVFAIDGGADESDDVTPVFEQVDADVVVEHGAQADAALEEQAAAPRDELDPDLLPVFIEEAVDYLPQIGENLQRWLANPGDASLPQTLMRHLHTVKGSARMAGAMTLGQQLHDIETRVEDLAALATVPANLIDELIGEYDGAVSEFEAIRDPALAAVRPRAGAAAATAEASGAAAASATPAASSVVGSTSTSPGAGDAAPSAEPVPPAPGAQAAAGAMSPADAAAAPAASSGAAPAAGQTPQPAQPLVRVRADLLDKLVNEAGEVSIARSRLD
ncbi:MAG TPA: Hpt domain-containing protein, partial [Quisquiliibacterium sp.]|nr:Hpt domain-containing protein [Quisquiliibacterium sp.]